MGLSKVDENENLDSHIKTAVVNSAYNKSKGKTGVTFVRLVILFSASLVAKVWNI